VGGSCARPYDASPPRTLSDTPACSHPTSHARALAVSSSRDLALCLPRTLGTSRALFLVASVTHSRTSVFRRSTSRAGQPRRHPRRGLVCARGGQTCGSGDAWCGVARRASVWSWRRCRFSTGLQRARSSPGRGVGGLCAARHRQTLALSAAVTDSCGWSGAWRAGEGAGKLLRAAVRRFLGAIGGSRAFVGAALGGFGAFIGAPGAVIRTRDCRVGAFLVGALGCGLGRRFGVARSVASRARRSASAACSAATADAARAWERASRACCSAVSALRRVSCATRSSSERRRGHGRCGHMFSGAEGAERSARARFGSSRFRTVVQRGRVLHRAAREVAHGGFMVPK